ncbi:MAG: cytochrome C [Thermomicrobiales bacterium]|jgi:c(7)-type cytochrome triheme protein|nr:MAG: cytochrome C [Thermomicrobiales bacterium]
MRTPIRVALVSLLAIGHGAAYADLAKGKAIYEKTCAVCHASGLAGAPKYGDAAGWAPRMKGGVAALYGSALNGKPPAMPKKGGALDTPDGDIKSAVDYMLASVQTKTDAKKEEKKPEEKAAKSDKPVEAAAKSPPAVQAAAAATVAPAPVAAPSPAVAGAAAAGSTAAVAPMTATGSADVNAFNRLLKPVGKRNLPPTEDGIHDPTNDGTAALQPPLAAYGNLPKSNAGNRIDWVQAIGGKKITPRWDRLDAKAEPVVMDLNIVREVKGSMPDVVYPHKQHTEWLDCSNCHPAIFVPQKGANQISMAAILLGQKCGVCHGKVAFPVSECRNCHSKKKDLPVAAAQKTTETK